MSKDDIDLTDFYDVERYKGRLMINKNGDLYSIWSNKILKPSKLPTGYITYILMMNNPRHTVTEYQHRLLAETFIPNPENKKTVNHIDGDKSNNRLENLEWATQSENNKHAIDNNLRIPNYKMILKYNKDRRIFSDDEVKYIREMKGKKSARELVNYFLKGHIDIIYDIWNNKTYKDVE